MKKRELTKKELERMIDIALELAGNDHQTTKPNKIQLSKRD